MNPKTFLSRLAVLLCLAAPAGAAVNLVPISSITGHQQGDSVNPNDGSISRIITGAGLTQVNPNNIATWTHDTAWQNGWQGGGANTLSGNVGWAVLDLGSAVGNLDDLYLWNVNEGGNPLQRGVQTFKIWYSTAPTSAPPAAGGSAASYSFSSGGWTQLGGTNNLAQGPGAATQTFSGSFDLGGISSARYIGLEFVTNYGSGFGGTDTVNRTGLAEIAITAIPEPGSALILAASVGAMILRRRGRAGALR